MTLIPEKVQEYDPDWELRDDPEYQYRVIKAAVQKKVIEELELGIEPSEQDVKFLGD